MTLPIDVIMRFVSKAREVRQVFKTIERLAEDLRAVEAAGLDGKFKALVAADPSFEPLQNAFNRAQRLVARAEALGVVDED